MALCGGLFDDRPAGELSSIISRGSTFAITMVYGLTQLVSSISTAAELSGHTRRVAALLRGLDHAALTTSEWRQSEEGGQESQLLIGRRGHHGVRAEAAAKTSKLSAERGPSSDRGEALLTSQALCVCVPQLEARFAAGSGRLGQPPKARASVLLLSGVELHVHAGTCVHIAAWALAWAWFMRMGTEMGMRMGMGMGIQSSADLNHPCAQATRCSCAARRGSARRGCCGPSAGCGR